MRQQTHVRAANLLRNTTVVTAKNWHIYGHLAFMRVSMYPVLGHGSSFSKYGCIGVVFLLWCGEGLMEINIEAILDFTIIYDDWAHKIKSKRQESNLGFLTSTSIKVVSNDIITFFSSTSVLPQVYIKIESLTRLEEDNVFVVALRTQFHCNQTRWIRQQ
jgi:hypothetical protein